MSYALDMSGNGKKTFSCDNLRVSVPHRLLVDALSIEISPGELVAVLGQNGCGKSLTMHTLAGLRSSESASILVNGSNLATARRKDIAKRLALLPQHVDDMFPATVLDTAMIGRHPHIGRLNW